MLKKYGEQRRAEAGMTLELHKAARENLHTEVEKQYGRGFVSAQESAENFARTVAWQQNLGRWWHALVPKIGFAGACFAAVMVVFSIAHREAQIPAAPDPASDFLEMTPLADETSPEIVPEAPLLLEDARGAEAPPAPIATRSPAPAESTPAAHKPSPQPVGEPQPEPAAMVADESSAQSPARVEREKRPQPLPMAPTKSTSTATRKIQVAPPVWQGKRASEIEVNLPEKLITPATVVSEPSPPTVAVAPMSAARTKRQKPVSTSTTITPLPTTQTAIAPNQKTAAAPYLESDPPAPAPSRTRERTPRTSPTATATQSFGLRASFSARHSPSLLRRFDVVLASKEIAIRDQDGSIYRGPASNTTNGAAEFTARGTSRSLSEAVNVRGRIRLGAVATSHAVEADVLLGDGSRFTLRAGQR